MICAFIIASNHFHILLVASLLYYLSLKTTLFLKYLLEPQKMSYCAFFKSVRRQRDLQNIFIFRKTFKIVSCSFCLYLGLAWIISPLQKQGDANFCSLYLKYIRKKVVLIRDAELLYSKHFYCICQ